MIDGHPDIILEKLQFLKDLELNNIYFGLSDIPPPPQGSFLPYTRINIVLSGSKKICMPLNDGAATIIFNPGDIQLSPANTWELQHWDTKSELLCLVQRPDYLRVSYYDIIGGSSEKRVNKYYHTHRLYPESFLYAFKAVDSFIPSSNHAIVKHLIKAVIDYSLEECCLPPTEGEGKSDHTFTIIKRYIENSFQEDIDRNSVAERFSMTPCYLSQLFKQKANLSFIDYLTNCRLDFAKYLLKQTSIPVYQVADQSGFNNYVHFVRRFRQCCGIPPGKYRETAS